ncbi:hypothetical protein [Tautonia sociabilis]|uniref:YfhO family protein n=1 Tax=Tautonia sociabilis TaxID=2080755 RepID=A0A432MFE2_9BACT|nr:hypothetical protein [Tautonia sociabilis]RUL84642.1 hypothetical protein TsocGM_20020 [Tautonia sociabilis]
MATDRPPTQPRIAPDRPGWRTIAVAAGLYAAAILAATWPAARDATTSIPHSDLGDPLLHLWILRWYRECLLAGRPPFWCSTIQVPVGAPLGYMPGLIFQGLGFLPLSAVVSGDALAYNLLWFGSLGFTAFAGFALGWWITRDGRCATLAGLAFVLSTPVLFNAHGALEMLSIGWFPLFLIAWIRFVDRPGPGRCASAAALYAALASGAPYFGILGAFPAALYVLFGLARARREGATRAWARGRLPWFVGFSIAVLPAVALVFSGQLWAMVHGFPMSRPDSEFSRYGASLFGYLLPDSRLPSGRLLDRAGLRPKVDLKVPSYLGVVTIGLLAYAAAARVRFDRRGFWWSALALLVLLSLGATVELGPVTLRLPAHWLREHTPVFRPIRVPARFNLFAAAVAVAIASAGLRDLLARLRWRPARSLLVPSLAILAVLDLSNAPFPTTRIPEVPPLYQTLRRLDPDARVLDAPQGDVIRSAICAYWSSFHGLPTSAGYTSFPNAEYEHLITEPSPFHAAMLSDPSFPADPDRAAVDLAAPARFRDLAWLYLSAHDYRFLVLHSSAAGDGPAASRFSRIREALAPALILDDGDRLVFDRELLPPPESPLLLPLAGWRTRLARDDRRECAVERSAGLVVYNPSPARPIRLAMELAGHRSRREVALLRDGAELARWTVEPGPVRLAVSPPLSLPAGLVELSLSCDSEGRPASELRALGQSDPFSLWAGTIVALPGDPLAIASPGDNSRTR